MIFSIYYSPPFLEIIKKVYKLKELQLFTFRKSKPRPPMLVSRLPFKSRLGFSLPFGFYQTSDCIQQLFLKEDWAQAVQYSRQTGMNISIASLGELPFGNGCHAANNPILCLREGKDPFAQYSKNHRQNIRKERNKATNFGVSVSFSSSKNDLLQFYGLMANQYVKDHMMLFQPFELFSRLFLSGIGRLLVAKHGDVVIGALFCIIESNIFHYNWGVRRQFRNLNIGTLLIDYAVMYAHQNRFRYFDFGSTPLSDDQLYNYKMKWGCGNHRVYKYFTKEVLPQVDLNSSFLPARYIYSKLPPKIAQLMMPFAIPWLVS